MDHTGHNKLVSFIWSITDDCLRNVYVRGKYRDVILPMFVLRRLDCLLEDSKDAVLEEVRFQREEAGFTDLDPEGLREVRPHVADVWLNIDKTQIGYEISFNKYFYQNTPLRSLEEVTAEILALEKETEGLLNKAGQFWGGRLSPVEST